MSLRKQLFLAAALALFLVSGTASAARAQVSAFVTILPQKYLVERIAGDLAEVNVLVQPGASPHTYEPTPRQMTALSGADLYMAVGINLEDAWLPRIRAANPDLRVFGVQRGVKKIPMVSHGHQGEEHGEHHDGVHEGHADHHDHAEHHDAVHEEHADHHDHAGHHDAVHEEHAEHHEHAEGEHHHHHGGLDPHIWLDPQRFAQIARNSCRALVKVDPANAATYEANLASLLAEIEGVDAEIEAMLSPLPQARRTFLVFHPAWGYFADRYHLTQVAIEAEGKEPGPKEMAEILDLCRKRDIRVIFVQPQISNRSARTIASELNAQVAPLDPLAENWKENILEAARAFKKSLE